VPLILILAGSRSVSLDSKWKRSDIVEWYVGLVHPHTFLYLLPLYYNKQENRAITPESNRSCDWTEFRVHTKARKRKNYLAAGLLPHLRVSEKRATRYVTVPSVVPKFFWEVVQ
jgi:hypothetical protein